MKKIIVATDGSLAAGKALDRAIEMTQKEPLEVVVLNVAEDYCPIGLEEIDCGAIRDLVMKESKGILAAAVEKMQSAGVAARGILETGSPADVIVEVAKREEADEIIAASHGRHGVKKLAMGSVISRVVEWASCPVTVVK